MGALVAVAVALTLWGERLPAPRGSDAPATEFSAERAMVALRAQTDLGRRLSGTPEERAAAERLATMLRAIPGMEVTIEEVAGSRQFLGTPYPYPMIVYRTLNVVGRLPGRREEAVLLDAHFDTTGSSDGAGDDAFGVAAIVEAARAVTAEGTPERTLLVLLNGGEEYGLRGADGFTRTPGAREVRAYLYLDGMARGRPRLVTTTAGHGELLEVFARAAPRPSANVVIQDIFDGGAVGGVDGDHRAFEDAGLAGISIACVDDLAASHTERDRLERVSPGSLQQMGETTLALTRALLDAPSLEARGGPRPVYFDVLGAFLVLYARSTSRVLAVLALALALGALVVGVRRGRLAPRRLAGAVGWTFLAQLAGLLAALGTAALLSFGIGRPHGWYAHPWLAGVVFPVASAAAILGVHAAFRRRLRDDEAAPWLAWGAAIAGWMGWLALAELRDAGASYLPLVWLASLSAGLLVALRWPARLAPALLASLVPGLVLTANVALPTLRAMLPQTGYMPLPIPADVPVALMISLGALMALGGLAIGAHVASSASLLGRAALTALGLATLGVVALALVPPYDRESPRRIIATHAEEDGRSAIALGSFDVLPLDPVLVGLEGLTPARDDWHPLGPYFLASHELAASAPPFAPPRVEVLRTSPVGADGTRTVSLRLTASTAHMHAYVPRARLVSWSYGPMPPEPAAVEDDMILFVAPRPEGETFELTLRGAEPVELEVRAVQPQHGPALEALARALPDHVVLWPEMTRIVRAQL